MRTITAREITDTIARLCIEANRTLSPDMTNALTNARAAEPWPVAKAALDTICQNLDVAKETGLPICQDTGMAVVFADIGQEVFIEGSFEQAVHDGVAKGYTEGFLRKSVVADPIRRGNTGDNTPAVIHTRLVPGDRVRLTVAPKGFGSENMSRIAMLKPAQGKEGVMDFIVETVRLAGPNPCPPIVVGVGIGGTFELCAMLAKRALLRGVDTHHPDPYYAEMEQTLLTRINALGIGAQGFGGKTTALGLQIETYPTHIAGMPVAVNISCHVTRHKEAVL
ncbi:MAG TPA: fumarate hydratase [Candidatus Ruthenibacterium avium]|uniref:Fumarate hydratase n=1 Tax=Candidatus Ruthenibacterium avium TaxID=2838751 RepID=A0A9D2S238_9FIRM|nr:fumarate hydratase [Candidatus Ruthenibacterium avium]